MKIITAKKVNVLLNKAKATEKSKEKAKNVFHMIFLGLSTRNYGTQVKGGIIPTKVS